MKLPSIAYITPVVHYDRDARVNVVEYRDAETGKVDLQIPGDKMLKVYRAEAVKAAPEDKVATAPDTPAEEGARPSVSLTA
jgi:hypothetical protein